jgi:hypothetical protein
VVPNADEIFVCYVVFLCSTGGFVVNFLSPYVARQSEFRKK